jgi:hypothetical protein
LPATFEIAGMEAEFVIDITPENYPKWLPSRDSSENADILFTLHTPDDDKFYIVAQIVKYIVSDDSRQTH